MTKKAKPKAPLNAQIAGLFKPAKKAPARKAVKKAAVKVTAAKIVKPSEQEEPKQVAKAPSPKAVPERAPTPQMFKIEREERPPEPKVAPPPPAPTPAPAKKEVLPEQKKATPPPAPKKRVIERAAGPIYRPGLKFAAPISTKPKESEKTARPAFTGSDKLPAGERRGSRKLKQPSTLAKSHDRFGSRSQGGFGQDSFGKRRRKRKDPHAPVQEADVPKEVSISLPITVKDLAKKMKRQASHLIAPLFSFGITATPNHALDEDAIEILSADEKLDCKIIIDTSTEEWTRVTDKSIKEEIAEAPENERRLRPPVVAFMGHIDHGKTSLIDAIRHSKMAEGEAGSITQHIGAFKCHTPVGELCILDTPGHEAFTAMRERGADATDIVVLVIDGKQGVQEQTIEAIKQAKVAKSTIVIALNKCDMEGFNPEKVYAQLAEHGVSVEAWQGDTICVHTSASTKQGIDTLLESLSLQSEVLELESAPKMRARGTVLESHKETGLGYVATLLVQNGTLNRKDAIVFDQEWAAVRTMHDEHKKNIKEAGPSTPVRITGLSGLPTAGEEFIVIENQAEAKNIAEARASQIRQTSMLTTKKKDAKTLLLEADENANKKTLNLILCGDKQGSVEAVEKLLSKIKSSKVNLKITATKVGEVSPSDVELASHSNATILAFHSPVDKKAAEMVHELGVRVTPHTIIYKALDDIKERMRQTLDKVPEEHVRGTATVKAIFKSSRAGTIAGCGVDEGIINKKDRKAAVIRNGKEIARTTVISLKRDKEDVTEVKKGFECGITLKGFDDFQEGDEIKFIETVYIEQEL